MTDKGKIEIKRRIQDLYRLANVDPVWDGEINDEVAAVFWKMLVATTECTKALACVPRPPSGRATVMWVASQLSQSAYNTYRDKLSTTCAREVIYKWRTMLELASQGLATKRHPTRV